jgi:GxxExxY protein
MNTNSEKLLLKDEVFQVVGCAIEVLNRLGHGLVEKPYENALVVEFSLRRIPFKQWRHPQLQAPEIRVGEDRLIKFVSIRVHSWLTA